MVIYWWQVRDNIPTLVDLSQDTFRFSLRKTVLGHFRCAFLSTSKQCLGDKCPLNVLRIRVQVVLLLARHTDLSNVPRGGNGHGLSQASARLAAGRDNKLR